MRSFFFDMSDMPEASDGKDKICSIASPDGEWECTRPRGHEGPHCAHMMHDTTPAMWGEYEQVATEEDLIEDLAREIFIRSAVGSYQPAAFENLSRNAREAATVFIRSGKKKGP